MNNDDLFPFSTPALRPVIFIKLRARLPEAIRINLRAAGSQAPGEALRLLLADIDEDPHQTRTVFDAAELQNPPSLPRPATYQWCSWEGAD